MNVADNINDQHDNDTMTYEDLHASTHDSRVPAVYEEFELSQQHVYCNVGKLRREALSEN